MWWWYCINYILPRCGCVCVLTTLNINHTPFTTLYSYSEHKLFPFFYKQTKSAVVMLTVWQEICLFVFSANVFQNVLCVFFWDFIGVDFPRLVSCAAVFYYLFCRLIFLSEWMGCFCLVYQRHSFLKPKYTLLPCVNTILTNIFTTHRHTSLCSALCCRGNDERNTLNIYAYLWRIYSHMWIGLSLALQTSGP